MTDLRLERLQGPAIATRLRSLAELRICVFREWPYLYDGTIDYETQYLGTYVRSSRSLAVVAWSDDHCVGATTVVPLTEAEPQVQQPFLDQGCRLDKIAYFGESLVLKEFRGNGLGQRFFEAREAHAQSLGLTLCTFCAVDRPGDHPSRPANYIPNDDFWGRRGYRRVATLKAQLTLQDVGDDAPSSKALTFWCSAVNGIDLSSAAPSRDGC
jgi:GNAT superfamily N-acetyltransferase